MMTGNDNLEPSVKPKRTKAQAQARAKPNRMKVPAPKPAQKRAKKKTNQKKDNLTQAMSRLGLKSETSYAAAWKESGGAVAASKELRVKYTDYFRSIPEDDDPDDPAGRMITYVLDPKSHFVDSTVGDAFLSTSGAKIHRVTVYAQTPTVADTSNKTSIVLFGLPVMNEANVVTTVAQQSTELVTSNVPRWVRVGGWSAAKTFGDSTLQPLTHSNESSGFALAKVLVLTAVDMGISATPVLFRIDYETIEALPLITVQKILVGREDRNDFWTGLPSGDTSYADIIADIAGFADTL
jgi:hypothetical protein